MSTRTYRFCPRCAHALVPMSTTTHRRRCPQCEWIYWGNAKPTASALVEREGAGGKEVLLVRRAIEPFRGMWDIPGGFIEVDERAEEAVCRELWEETALRIRPLEVLGTWPDVYPYGGTDERTLNIFFLAVLDSPAHMVPGDDVADATWFSLDALPRAEETAFTSCARALDAWRQRQDRRRL